LAAQSFKVFQSKQEAPKQICITCPLVLCRKKYVAEAWNWVELPLLLKDNPGLGRSEHDKKKMCPSNSSAIKWKWTTYGEFLQM
jgi:hypothetical protein